jgi:hypothetical protein
VAPKCFFIGLLGVYIGLGGDHADVSRLHPERLQKLPHLYRFAGNPRQDCNPGRRLGYGRGWTLLEIGLYRPAMAVEGTA